jgi:hypothetical protein
MAFCDHCQAQRFDRSRVLRKLRTLRKQLQTARCSAQVDDAMAQALEAVRSLDIPHVEVEDYSDDVVVH